MVPATTSVTDAPGAIGREDVEGTLSVITTDVPSEAAPANKTPNRCYATFLSTPRRRCVSVTVFVGLFLMLVLCSAAVASGLLLLKAMDSQFTLLGANIAMGCTANVQYGISLLVQNPSPFALKLTTLELDIYRKSTGDRIATTVPTMSGPIEITSGESEQKVSGVFTMLHAPGLVGVMKSTELGARMEAMDAEVVAHAVVSTSAILGIPLSIAQTMRLDAGAVLADVGSGAPPACAVEPALRAANVSLWGDEAVVQADVTAGLGLGPCMPSWRQFEVETPTMHFVGVAAGTTDVVGEISVPSFRADLRQPELRVPVRLALRQGHAAAASGVLQAAMGKGPMAAVQLLAPGSADCFPQEILAGLPPFYEVSVPDLMGGNGSAGGGQQLPEGALVLTSVSGGLGGGPGTGAQLQLAANLSKLLPERLAEARLSVSGYLPEMDFALELERSAPGSPPVSSAIAELAKVSLLLGGGAPLQTALAVSLSEQWTEALAFGMSTGAATGAELAARLHIAGNSSVISKLLAWWKFEQRLSFQPQTAAAVAKVASTPDSASLDLQLHGLVKNSSIWGDAQARGSVNFSAAGKHVGSAALAAQPLLSGLGASLLLGAEALKVLPAAFEPLPMEGRPGVPLEGHGVLSASLPAVGFLGAVAAEVGVALAFQSGRSPSEGQMDLTLSALADSLNMSGSLGLAVDAAWDVRVSGELSVRGAIGSGTALPGVDVAGALLNLTLTVPAVDPTDPKFQASAGAGPLFVNRARLALLGGAAPGEPLEVPCVIEGICSLGARPPLPITMGLAADGVLAEVGPLRLESLSATIETSAVVQATVGGGGAGPEYPALNVSLRGGNCSVDHGAFRATVGLEVLNESAVAQVLQGGAWNLRVGEGARRDFLGVLGDSFRKPLMEGMSAGAPPQGPPPDVAKFLKNVTLLDTDPGSMSVAMRLTQLKLQELVPGGDDLVPSMDDVTAALGDALEVSASFDGRVIARVFSDTPLLSTRGGPFNLDARLLAPDAAAHQSLTELLKFVASDLDYGSVPEVYINGSVRAAEVPGGGFPISMKVQPPSLVSAMIPQRSPGAAVDCAKEPVHIKLTELDIQLFPPAIAMGMEVSIATINPLPFDLILESMTSTSYLRDLDGVNKWYAQLPPDPMVFMGPFSITERTVLKGEYTTQLTNHIHTAGDTAWRSHEEFGKGRMEMTVRDGNMTVSIKAPASAAAFQLQVLFATKSVTVYKACMTF